jgi:hypothetical protein
VNSLRSQKCRDCPTIVSTRQYLGRPVLCPKCKTRIKSANDARRWRRNHELLNDPDSYIVIYDPDEAGGFSSGSEFHRDDIRCMLKYNCFTIGTRLKNMRGKLFVIKETIDGKHELAIV